MVLLRGGGALWCSWGVEVRCCVEVCVVAFYCVLRKLVGGSVVTCCQAESVTVHEAQTDNQSRERL